MTETSETTDETEPKARPTPLGIYDRPGSEGITNIEVVAIALSGVWLIAAALFFLLVPSESDVDGLRRVMVVLAILLPIGMIWIGATAIRSSRVMREESQRLQAAIDAIRQSYIAQTQSGVVGPDPGTVVRKLDEIAATARKAEIALTTFASQRDHLRPAEQVAETGSDDQPLLELGTQAADLAPPLAVADFILALNFPETAEDKAGFAALRRALQDRMTAQLIQAAQDVLTLLSQDGIYMDDLRPDRARPEVWRQFGQGARGRPIAALGGVRDRSSLALTAGRMKQDPIFRDAAHHFLRLFDKTFAEFEKTVTDGEISALAETRTARAFMLLGRVAGTFD
ncbi:hypothetical protein So717_39640 [Roseobacter cerasinus]|uniref:Uncharacterized protein n=1 Tax=Roseobacter cerasinus TaxID=2602289 RepID=A0A640VYN1_9RHOB|nr:hypothetical protein [Roseobacter cerasinus]GFE52211.1 hypothetical protein So717_39640 [Roseobacter cerasinus]